MENYEKGKVIETPFERDKLPFTNLPVNFLWMQVKGGSKMNNLLSHAINVLKDGSTKIVVWSGAGAGLPKAVSCAEITKKELKIDQQITRLTDQNIEEFWEPKLENLEQLVVQRRVPVIHILLSREELDSTEIGFQSLSSKKFWMGVRTNSKKPQVTYGKRKLPKNREQGADS